MFFFGSSLIKIDFSFDSFFPKNTPQYQYFQKFKNWFIEDQNYAVHIAIKSPKEDIFDINFLLKVDSLFKQIYLIEGIDSTITLTDLTEYKRTALGFKSKPYFHLDDSTSLIETKSKLLENGKLQGVFFTSDLKYICGYAIMNPSTMDSPNRDKITANIQEYLDQHHFEYIISGVPYVRGQYVSRIRYELGLFTLLSILLVILILYLTYKQIWGIIIPLATVLLGLLGLTGLIGFTGGSLTLLSNLLIPIMFVVGMSDVIHIITKYLQERTSGNNVDESIRTTLKEIGFAVFLTSLTTAVGFASLAVSRVPPIRIFGLYAAAGVMIAFTVAIAILPYCLTLLDKVFVHHNRPNKSLAHSDIWEKWLSHIYQYVKERENAILGGFGLFIAFCIYLTTLIPTNTFLIEGISSNDPIKKSIDFFEQQAYGMHAFEIGFHPAKGHSLTEPDVLIQMEKIQHFLSEQSRFSPFLSLASYVSESNYAYHFNREQHQVIPDSEAEIQELLDWSSIQGGDQFIKTFYYPEDTVGRISARMGDLGTDSMNILYTRLDSFVNQHCDTTLFSYEYTGHTYLTELNLKYLQKSLLYGLVIAFIIIGIMMGVLFKSWQMLWISMIPNVIPLLFTGGVMGLFGITLNASTAIIFVIAFGIAVDDTIHFLNRFRIEKQLGYDTNTAILHTTLGTGKAMILTSLVLIAGFIMLTASDFGSTFHTGLFTGLTILFALLADLFLLPILLRKYVN